MKRKDLFKRKNRFYRRDIYFRERAEISKWTKTINSYKKEKLNSKKEIITKYPPKDRITEPEEDKMWKEIDSAWDNINKKYETSNILGEGRLTFYMMFGPDIEIGFKKLFDKKNKNIKLPRHGVDRTIRELIKGVKSEWNNKEIYYNINIKPNYYNKFIKYIYPKEKNSKKLQIKGLFYDGGDDYFSCIDLKTKKKVLVIMNSFYRIYNSNGKVLFDNSKNNA